MVLDRVIAISVALLIVTGAVTMVSQRAYYDRWYYISEFGAEGLPTEADFKLGFSVLAFGLVLAAWPLRTIRHAANGKRLIVAPWLTTALSGICFVIASQVNCTENCPGLANPEASLRDHLHVWIAIFGFVFGCLTMLLVAIARAGRMRAVTITAAALVAVISGVGGLLSLAGDTSEFGAMFEHVAAGVGLLWLLWAVMSEVSRAHRSLFSEPQQDSRQAPDESTNPQPADPALDQA